MSTGTMGDDDFDDVVEVDGVECVSLLMLALWKIPELKEGKK